MPPSPHDIWQSVLTELQQALTKATYNTWLKSSKGLAFDGSTFRVGVINPYGVDWLENRLRETVERAFAAVTGTAVPLVFEVLAPETQLALPGLLPDTGGGSPPAGINYPDYQFGGFTPPKANYVQVPKEIVYLVAPSVRPTVTLLVLFVLAETIGVVVDGYGNRRREWVTTYPQARLVMNMGRSTIYTAVWEGRAHGLIVQRLVETEPERKLLAQQAGLVLNEKTTLFTLRPRWVDEAIDYPLEARPMR